VIFDFSGQITKPAGNLFAQPIAMHVATPGLCAVQISLPVLLCAAQSLAPDFLLLSCNNSRKMNMSLPRTYYLIYSPAVAEQLASVIAHPILAEQGIAG
jgi:hypothetical protein